MREENNTEPLKSQIVREEKVHAWTIFTLASSEPVNLSAAVWTNSSVFFSVYKLKEFASFLLTILFCGWFLWSFAFANCSCRDTFSAIFEAPSSQRPCFVFSTLKRALCFQILPQYQIWWIILWHRNFRICDGAVICVNRHRWSSPTLTHCCAIFLASATQPERSPYFTRIWCND